MNKAFSVGLAAMVFLVGCSTSRQSKVGGTWYVSNENVVLRSAPSEFAVPVANLPYKESVVVTEDVRVALPYAGEKKFDENLVPLWVKVKAGGKTGYVPETALVSDWLVANQDPNADMSPEGIETVAKRGFSEDEEDAEGSGMLGAAGQGGLAKTGDLPALMKIVDAHRAPVDADVSKFISDGSMKSRPASPTVINKAGPGVVGSFVKGARQTLAQSVSVTTAIATQNDNSAGGALVSGLGGLVADALYSETGPVQEYLVGKVIASRVVPTHPVVPANDPRSVYVKQVGTALAYASNVPTAYKGYHFILQDSPEVNAFAVPGGFVFITTAMLDFLKNEDELAAILGHEMGHMELGHGMKAVDNEKILKLFNNVKKIVDIRKPKTEQVATAGQANGDGSLVIGTLIDDLLNDTLKKADEIYNEMTAAIRNGYSVELESQADWRALQLTSAVGYDPKALYVVLERFKEFKGSYGGAAYPTERSADILKYLKGLGLESIATKGRDVRVARYQQAVKKAVK